jgi:hypothetical protein
MIDGMTKGMNLKHWAWLCRGSEMLGNLYLVSDRSVPAAPPTYEDKLPWPVVLLLATHSRKHRFLSGALPQLQPYVRGIEDLANKVKWAWRFRHNEPGTRSALCKRSTRHFEGLASPEIMKFATNLKYTLGKLIPTMLKNFKRRHSASIPAFVKIGCRWLSENNLRGIQSDKDGVFVIVPMDVLEDMIFEKLLTAGGSYREVATHTIDIEYRCASGLVESACKLLRKLDLKDWAAEASHVFYSRKGAGLVCKVQATIKTHKPIPEVRILHASASCSLEGFSRILHIWLSEVLLQVSFLVPNTASLLREIRKKKFPESCVLCKFDVKDFYMSGNHSTLVELSLGVLPPERRKAAGTMLWLVLGSQFVCRSGRLFRVLSGTGMGQVHSGALSDIGFWQLVETKVDRNRFGILEWVRFRDDLLLVVKTREDANNCLVEMNRLAAGCWKIEVESISQFSAKMLDCMIYKGPSFERSGFLDFCPYIKKTARHIPLCSRSNHPPAVHRSWPVSEIRRMKLLSLHRSVFEHFKFAKIARFTRFFMDPVTLRKCELWRGPIGKSTKSPTRDKGAGRVCRLIVPWHPALGGLGIKLRVLFEEWQPAIRMGSDGILCLNGQVAFSLSGRPLFSLVR